MHLGVSNQRSDSVISMLLSLLSCLCDISCIYVTLWCLFGVCFFFFPKS